LSAWCAQGLGEKALSRCCVALSREQEVDRRTAGVHTPVQIGATQGTLRQDPISRLRPLRTRRAEPPALGLEFPFQYCPWQFPNKVDCQSAFFNALQVENSASAHFEKSRGSKSKRLACDKAHPSLPILVFSRGDAAIASGPLVLMGLIAACLV
jgi:hypothetical protein